MPPPVLAERDRAHVLVLIVHADEASRPHAGHGFVADVLRANGLGALPFTLQAPGEHASGNDELGMVQAKRRLRSVLDGLAAQPDCRGRPVALIGVAETAAACAAVAARRVPLSVCALVLLDGRPERFQDHLCRLTLPTLFVVGRCDERSLMRHRHALHELEAPHRLEMLRYRPWPTLAPGALEAFSCVALSWLSQTLPVSADAPTVRAAG